MSLKTLAVIMLLLSTSTSEACGLITSLFTSQSVPLSYVGKVSFQKQITQGNFTRIPVTFTGGKWNENSGRVLKGIKSKQRGDEVHFTVETCLAGDSETGVHPEIRLKSLPPGKYQLIYIDPGKTRKRLGEIEM